MQKQKGFTQTIFLAVIALIVIGAGAYYYFTVKSNEGKALPISSGVSPQYQADYLQGAQNVSPVKSGADLNKVLADLDNTDLSQIDSGIVGLNAD